MYFEDCRPGAMPQNSAFLKFSHVRFSVILKCRNCHYSNFIDAEIEVQKDSYQLVKLI